MCTQFCVRDKELTTFSFIISGVQSYSTRVVSFMTEGRQYSVTGVRQKNVQE